MQFLSPEIKQSIPEVIPNNSFWPDVDLGQYHKVMRSDGTVTPERLKQIVLSAISEVNTELYAWRESQELMGYSHLDEVPASRLGNQSQRVHHYLNAIWCWVRAALYERYADYDATASGNKRGGELEKVGDGLWRDARWAISRVQGQAHCTVELI